MMTTSVKKSAEKGLGPPWSIEKISTGTMEMDEVLNSGIPLGSLTLLSGPFERKVLPTLFLENAT